MRKFTTPQKRRIMDRKKAAAFCRGLRMDADSKMLRNVELLLERMAGMNDQTPKTEPAPEPGEMELKPCPHCRHNRCIHKQEDLGIFFVECWRCKMRGPERGTEEESVQAWGALPRHKYFDAEMVKPKESLVVQVYGGESKSDLYWQSAAWYGGEFYDSHSNIILVVSHWMYHHPDPRKAKTDATIKDE